MASEMDSKHICDQSAGQGKVPQPPTRVPILVNVDFGCFGINERTRERLRQQGVTDGVLYNNDKLRTLPQLIELVKNGEDVDSDCSRLVINYMPYANWKENRWHIDENDGEETLVLVGPPLPVSRHGPVPILVNECFGGFGINERTREHLRQLGVKDDDILRTLPQLIEMVKNGEDVDSDCSRLVIKYVPYEHWESERWYIHEYDGVETLTLT